jgi:di/tricarboxylate transporter
MAYLLPRLRAESRANLGGASGATLISEEPGYGFSDYWKLGLPLLVLYGAVAIGLVPVFWKL